MEEGGGLSRQTDGHDVGETDLGEQLPPRRAVEAGGSSLGSGAGNYRQHDGLSGLFQHSHAVYGRGGEPCPRCGRPLKQASIGQRASVWCGHCQR